MSINVSHWLSQRIQSCCLCSSPEPLLKSVNMCLGRDRDSLSRHGWLVCQHDLAARDDRDPSQNSAMAGKEHRGGGRRTDNGGPGRGWDQWWLGWHTAGLLDRLHTVWFKPPATFREAKSTITWFSCWGDVRAWKKDPGFSRWPKLAVWLERQCPQTNITQWHSGRWKCCTYMNTDKLCQLHFSLVIYFLPLETNSCIFCYLFKSKY